MVNLLIASQGGKPPYSLPGWDIPFYMPLRVGYTLLYVFQGGYKPPYSVYLRVYLLHSVYLRVGYSLPVDTSGLGTLSPVDTSGCAPPPAIPQGVLFLLLYLRVGYSSPLLISRWVFLTVVDQVGVVPPAIAQGGVLPAIAQGVDSSRNVDHPGC